MGLRRMPVRGLDPAGGTAGQAVVIDPTGSKFVIGDVAGASGSSTSVSTPISPASPVAPSGTLATTILGVLKNVTKYAMGYWWNTDKNFDAQDANPYLSFGGTTEDYIRPSASEAYALSIALYMGAYDATFTGVDATTATNRTVRLITSLAHQHRATAGGSGWGLASQTAIWASWTAFAAWLLWNQIPASDQTAVLAMLTLEADAQVSAGPTWWKDRAGSFVGDPGNGQGEEDAWNSTIGDVAAAMLPDHPNQQAWLDSRDWFAIAASAMPTDLDDTTPLSGKQVQEWLDGTNVNDDGTAVNHSYVPHPDYMAGIVHMNGQAGIVAALTGDEPPKSCLHNAEKIYYALTDLNFASPPFDSPDGTIYTPSSSAIYYPDGDDWGSSRRDIFMMVDLVAYAFGRDVLSTTGGDAWGLLHGGAVAALQARGSTGQTYQSGDSFSYAGREELAAWSAAVSWACLWIRSNDLIQGPLDIPLAAETGGAALTVKDEGTTLDSAVTSVDFVGDIVEVTTDGAGHVTATFTAPTGAATHLAPVTTTIGGGDPQLVFTENGEVLMVEVSA